MAKTKPNKESVAALVIRSDSATADATAPTLAALIALLTTATDENFHIAEVAVALGGPVRPITK
jgi:hypothetical protein